MTSVQNRAAILTTSRKPLSREQFERMCYRAARSSITCRGYIRRLLKHLCLWLNKEAGLNTLLPECRPGRGNVQQSVIFLYWLLEEKCVCDFNIVEVLNSYHVGGDSSSNPGDLRE